MKSKLQSAWPSSPEIGSTAAEIAPSKKSTTKTRNGKKKMKTKKPVVINKTGKTEGETSVNYEDEEVEVEMDSDDDDDEWDEEN